VEAWEKRLSENEAKGGIIVKNDKAENIEKCYVEINEIYDEDGLGLYGQRQAELPRTAGWEIDGKIFYGETEITVGKRKYLALAYESWIMSGSSYFLIGGNNNFQHHVSTNEKYFIELEISGVVKGVQLILQRDFALLRDFQVYTSRRRFCEGGRHEERKGNSIKKTTGQWSQTVEQVGCT